MCTIEGCDEPAVVRGYCRKHYMRLRRNGDPTKSRRRGRKWSDPDLAYAQTYIFPHANKDTLLEYKRAVELLHEIAGNCHEGALDLMVAMTVKKLTAPRGSAHLSQLRQRAIEILSSRGGAFSHGGEEPVE